MQKVIDLLAAIIADESFIDCTISSPRDKGSALVTKVSVRPILLREQLLYQFTYHQAASVLHSNLDPAACQKELVKLLQNEFSQAQLFAVAADYHIFINKNDQARILTRPASKKKASMGHNRKKNYILPFDRPCAFLTRLGIMNKRGQVLPSRMNKFKQVNRFLEMVDDVIDHLPQDRELSVIDFGCGKSYLTFALYYYLHEQQGLDVKIIGLDLKADVVRHCNTIAEDLGWSKLRFWVGDIKDYEHVTKVDLVVSLHACDTATDLALAKAVAWQSRVILAVPCCQQELLRSIANETMQPLMKHGILKERLASLITDSLRASALEIMGYKVQVLEFIETAHTAKNLLLRAVYTPQQETAQATEAYLTFRDAWSLKDPFIEKAFGAPLQNKLDSKI